MNILVKFPLFVTIVFLFLVKRVIIPAKLASAQILQNTDTLPPMHLLPVCHSPVCLPISFHFDLKLSSLFISVLTPTKIFKPLQLHVLLLKISPICLPKLDTAPTMELCDHRVCNYCKCFSNQACW